MAERQPFRMSQGGRIDRDKPLEFRFEGRGYTGYAGDSLASALLANGVKVVARSFKYHRPRGIYSGGEEEPCALVEVGQGTARQPSCRAPTVPLRDGLVARAQAGWPSLGFDLGRVLDFTAGLWPAGFYNKTFMWPNWQAWEGLIRRLSALGRLLRGPDPDRYERMNWHCDLLVCGGGPAGLLATLAAGRAGLSVLLAEQDREFGGVLLKERVEIDGAPAADWLAEVLAELERLPNVLRLPGTTVTAIYDHKVTTLLQAGDGSGWRECYWTVRPNNIVFASGAIEQGLLFPNNDRPGIMLAGAVREYLNRYAVVPGQKVIVATNNDSAYQTALDLAAAEIDVIALIDTRPQTPHPLEQAIAEEGIAHYGGASIRDTRGSKGIRRIRIDSADGRSEWHDCDLLAVSGGWAPRMHLFAQAGGRLRFDRNSCSFLPDAGPQGIYVAGSAAGASGLSESLGQALDTARAICDSLGRRVPDLPIPQATRDIVAASKSSWSLPRPSRPRHWLDLAHDVTTADAELAVREGFDSVEHFKRYTTAGMSVDQGKTSNNNASVLLSTLTGKDPAESGTTTFRPPYSPVTLGAIAAHNTGEFYAPRRYLPAHAEHEALGARFDDYGWQRPQAYPQPGERLDDATQREARAVRTSAGVFDNSPIGKIEVCGPDAAVFLDRLYINDMVGLRPGRARYGLMLNENGVIVDDGVVVRMAGDHFVVHTTSGNVERIRETMEEWLQCEWRDLRVVVHDATTQWANFTVAGPRAVDTLKALGCELSPPLESLPHMSAAGGTVAGIEVRIARVSYSGERSYELNVPASYAAGLLWAILEAGAPFGIAPIGVEALMVLRTEKGFLHVGTDSDGSTTPDDVGWGHVARKKERDFIGRRSLLRPANTERGRRQLVGLEATKPGQALRAGAHLLNGEGRKPPAPSDGWITSACFSPILQRPIALAMLRDGRDRQGEPVTVCDEGERFLAKVVSPVFYDPDNTRLA